MSHGPEDQKLHFLPIPETSYSLVLHDFKTYQIDSDEVFLTVTKTIKGDEDPLESRRLSMEHAKLEEIEILMRKNVIIPIPHSDDMAIDELQKLNWVLVIKTSTIDASKNRHRARLVSTSITSIRRHSVHGNAPTINLSSCRITMSVIPTWMSILKQRSEGKERTVIFSRYVTKSFLQSDKSNRLIIYKSPKELFDAYPQYSGHAWKAIIHLYGEVESGLYWYKTLIPWLMKVFPGIQQAMYDPYLLFCPQPSDSYGHPHLY